MIACGVMLPENTIFPVWRPPHNAGIRLLFLCRKKKYRKEVRVETENFVIVCHNLLFYLYLYHSL